MSRETSQPTRENLRLNPEEFNPELAADPKLFQEFSQATHHMVKRIESMGIWPALLVVFGSLSRHDKKLRPSEVPGVFDSDADFLCLADRVVPRVNIKSIDLLRKGETSLRRQIDGEKAEPFSPHIPNFQVEFFTVNKVVALLDEVAEIIREYRYSGTDVDDLAEEHRWIVGKLVLVRHLQQGIVVLGAIPQEVASAVQRVVSAYEQSEIVYAQKKQKAQHQ